MKSCSLSVTEVTKDYSGHRALNRVSLDVEEGTIFGLLGPNGAGKTSLIRIINQITAPDSGEVRINGHLLSPDHVHIIGYLPEERGLYKKMKIGEQMIYLARLKGLTATLARTRLRAWFEKFEIQSWWDKKVEELSKGMAQKVQFISTVLHSPQLLILDEPFSGFDPINAALIKNEILELKRLGTTIILSTHNMNSVEEICDKIALINKSEKVLEGKVKDVRAGFRSDKIRITFKGNLIDFTNRLWTGYELLEHSGDEELITCLLKSNNGGGLNPLLQAILPFVEVVSAEELVPGMTEIFIRSVGNNPTVHE